MRHIGALAEDHPAIEKRAKSYKELALRIGAAACATLSLFGAAPAGVTAARGMDGCKRLGYNYSGEIGSEPVSSVGATILESAEPHVKGGQIAGWAGVNSPDGSEWLQAGIEQAVGQTAGGIYYESKIKGTPRQFVELGTVGVGQPVRVLIKEDLPKQPNHWTLFINGRPQPIDFFLPHSQSRLIPQITGESLEGPDYTCNTFRFRFDQIKVINSHGHKTRQSFWKTTAPAYRLRQVSADGFTAGDISQ